MPCPVPTVIVHKGSGGSHARGSKLMQRFLLQIKKYIVMIFSPLPPPPNHPSKMKDDFFWLFAPSLAHYKSSYYEDNLNQPEDEDIAKCGHIKNLWRRQFCGMVVGLDRLSSSSSSSLSSSSSSSSYSSSSSSLGPGRPSAGRA